jgi:hypothetical protein
LGNQPNLLTLLKIINQTTSAGIHHDEVKASQADLDLIFWIRVDLCQKGMRHDRGALDRALVFVVSPSIQDSVDERCRFRRGSARTFLSHIPAMHAHQPESLG